MDAHGGWLATAKDFARFAMALDHPDASPLLSAASIAEMYTRPRDRERPAVDQEAGNFANGAGDGAESAPRVEDLPDYYYSLGWSNRVVGSGRVNHWHTGSLPGTAAILIRRHDGKTLVALVNCRAAPPGQDVKKAIDRMLHRAADQFEWADSDE